MTIGGGGNSARVCAAAAPPPLAPSASASASRGGRCRERTPAAAKPHEAARSAAAASPSNATTSSSETGEKSAYQCPTASSRSGTVWQQTSSASSRQDLEGLPSADRDGDDDPRGVLRAQRSHRRERGQTGREPIVDEDRPAPAHLERSARAAVALDAAAQLARLARDRRIQRLLRHPGAPHGGGVDGGEAALGDRADRELRVAGRAQLAHGEQLEGRTDRPCDLEAHGHPSPRQRHDHRGRSGGREQRRRKHPPSLVAVCKHGAAPVPPARHVLDG